jgi:hypothetical protein
MKRIETALEKRTIARSPHTPMASPREDTASRAKVWTGLQYKFQSSSATVTYSRS